MIESVTNSLSFMPDWLQLLIISAIPIIELRGAIPWGIFMLHMPPVEVFFLCWLGSIVPAPFILLLIQKILGWMRRSRHFAGLAHWLDKKALKGSKKIARYKFWGLTIFVAIPLPGTGVWTGCLAASFLEMDFKQAMLSVILGSAIAGVVVTTLCQMGLMVAS